MKWSQWNGVVFVIFKSLRHFSKPISEGNTHGTKGVDFWSGGSLTVVGMMATFDGDGAKLIFVDKGENSNVSCLSTG